MQVIANKFRGSTEQIDIPQNVPFPSDNADAPRQLLTRCPRSNVTPLHQSDALAALCNVQSVHLKDERERMGLGSFKALGAAYVIACDAENGTTRGTTYVSASAGNHGLSVAAGAAAFGGKAVIYLSSSVPESFAERLEAEGASVVRHGDNYAQSMEAAMQAASDNGWKLLSDTSWGDYLEIPHRLMEGYLTFMAETVDQMDEPPTHIFAQAGVGGLACAVAIYARKAWGDAPIITIVEPDAAPALYNSIIAGRCVETDGPVSSMGRLDCKEPSLISLKGLARDADFYALVSEEEAATATATAASHGFESSPSGAAGLTALFNATTFRDELGITEQSRVMVVISEGPA